MPPPPNPDNSTVTSLGAEALKELKERVRFIIRRESPQPAASVPSEVRRRNADETVVTGLGLRPEALDERVARKVHSELVGRGLTNADLEAQIRAVIREELSQATVPVPPEVSRRGDK